MKIISNSLALIAASVVIAGTASAQDSFLWLNRGSAANSTGGYALSNPENAPKVELGSNLQLTGLLVDCFKPQQTWVMLTASVPNPQSPMPPSLTPITPLKPISDPADDHESGFVLLRLSFP